MASGLITRFLGQGTTAARPADPDIGDAIGLYWSTDNDELSMWAESAWVEDILGTGGALLVANNLDDLGSPATALANLGLSSDGASLVAAANYAAMRALLVPLLGSALPLTFNFNDAGDAYAYADEAMTLTEQATVGTGTIAYEKSTTAAPSTFSSTTSPVSLQAGAWLKVSASSVTGGVAVHMKRTA